MTPIPAPHEIFNRFHDLSRIGLLAMVGGAIASLMGACVVEVLM